MEAPASESVASGLGRPDTGPAGLCPDGGHLSTLLFRHDRHGAGGMGIQRGGWCKVVAMREDRRSTTARPRRSFPRHERVGDIPKLTADGLVRDLGGGEYLCSAFEGRAALLRVGRIEHQRRRSIAAFMEGLAKTCGDRLDKRRRGVRRKRKRQTEPESKTNLQDHARHEALLVEESGGHQPGVINENVDPTPISFQSPRPLGDKTSLHFCAVRVMLRPDRFIPAESFSPLQSMGTFQ